jgi:5-methylcytosine-specific restriction endonuclease McrA
MMTTIEEYIKPNTVVVVDSSMGIVNTVEWTRAVTMLIAGEAYTILPRSDGAEVRSVSMSLPWPLVVSLNRFVQHKYREFNDDDHVSRRVIFTRDDWECQYCGEHGNTIDHVMPKSRGGKNTWGNMVAACRDCNHRKADRTPQEAGMSMPIIPAKGASKRLDRIQMALYKALEDAVSTTGASTESALAIV